MAQRLEPDRLSILAFLAVATLLLIGAPAWADNVATQYAGSVVMVDVKAGKLAVKKDGGGSRFTFVVNDKTQFDGDVKSLKDIKEGASVVVRYVVEGPQYVALKVTGRPK